MLSVVVGWCGVAAVSCYALLVGCVLVVDVACCLSYVVCCVLIVCLSLIGDCSLSVFVVWCWFFLFMV